MTCYDLPGVQRARIAVEPNGGFGLDLTGSMGNFSDIRVTGANELVRDDQFVDDETIVQRIWQRNEKVRGVGKCSYALESLIVGSDEILAPTTSPTKSVQSLVMEALLGGYQADSGSTWTSAATTGGTVTAGHGSRFAVGQLIGLPVSNSIADGMQVRLVTAVSGDAVSFWPAVPVAPTVGVYILNGQNVYPTDCPDTTLQVLIEAAVNRGNIWLGKGMQGDLSLNISRGQLASWSSSLTGAAYEHDDDFVTPQGGSAIAAATLTDSGPLVVSGSALHFGPIGSTAQAYVRDSGLTFGLGRSWQEVPDYAGVEGQGQWHISRSEITAELTLPFIDETYHDAMVAGTKYGLILQIGSTKGQSWAIAMPTVQIVKVEPAEANGLVGQKLTLHVLENELSTDKTTELRRAPFVMAQI